MPSISNPTARSRNTARNARAKQRCTAGITALRRNERGASRPERPTPRCPPRRSRSAVPGPLRVDERRQQQGQPCGLHQQRRGQPPAHPLDAGAPQVDADPGRGQQQRAGVLAHAGPRPLQEDAGRDEENHRRHAGEQVLRQTGGTRVGVLGHVGRAGPPRPPGRPSPRSPTGRSLRRRGGFPGSSHLLVASSSTPSAPPASVDAPRDLV